MTRVRLVRGTSWTVLLAFFTALTGCGGGEEAPPPTTTLVVPTTVPTTVVPTTAPPPTMPAQPPEQLSKAQLQELVAPVALYPDIVLASLLPATTYPDQVADAAAYVRQQNGQVQGVPEDRNWDGSVAGLLQFPDVLNWLDQNDPWEEQMGSAMTYQQGDVLQAIQDYRQLALDAGNLKSNEYMKVEAQPNQDIRIEPAQPDTVYVPQYDTAAVTQPQEKTGINPWLAFGGGAVVGALGAWALYSIFDDDDDDHHHHGGGKGGHNKKVKVHDNVYYGRGRRPPGGDWNARPRPGRPGRPGNQIARPKPMEPVYSKPGTKPAAGGGSGVRPPQRRPGQGGGGGGQVARPTPAPAPGGATPMAGPKKQGGGKGDRKGGGGDGGGKKQQKGEASPAPSVRQGKSQTGDAKPQAQQAQPQQQKKQGGGGGGGGGQKKNQGGGQKKKKKKGGGDN
jgi:hypothetical protein